MNFSYSETQIALVEAARDFSSSLLAPNAADWDVRSHFPLDVIKHAGSLGFCGLYTPSVLGGMGLSRLDSALILEELACGCTSTAAYIGVHNMVTWMVASWGQEDVARAFVPQMTTGELLGSYCLTEAEAGSDAAAIRTLAERLTDHYEITGNKLFISGAGDTDVLVVMARTERGISAFLVPADAEGVNYGEKEKKMGWCSQPTRSVSFDHVRVPSAYLLGEEGQGFPIAMKALDGGRISIAACSIGTARSALQYAKNYARERSQFGKTLDEFQHTQFKMADLLTELTAAKQLTLYAAHQLDHQSQHATALCAMAKRFASDAGFKICHESLQILGGYGYIKDYPLERHLRDSRVHQILEGTNEIMRLIIARHILKQDSLEDVYGCKLV